VLCYDSWNLSQKEYFYHKWKRIKLNLEQSMDRIPEPLSAGFNPASTETGVIISTIVTFVPPPLFFFYFFLIFFFIYLFSQGNIGGHVGFFVVGLSELCHRRVTHGQ